MPRGYRHEWTREELERVLVCKGTQAHTELADELNVTANTIYSTRGKVRTIGGIDAFLEAQAVAGTPLKPREIESLSDQLRRIYRISIASAGRDGTAQYGVTLPPRVAERFVELYGRQVRFEPRDGEIAIIPIQLPPVPPVPKWLEGAE